MPDLEDAIELSGSVVRKYRKYISDPSEAPPGKRVVAGTFGGHYYETGGSGKKPASPKPPAAGPRQRPTDPRERSMQGDQDAAEDAEGLSSDEIKQLARRSNILALPWKGMTERQAKTYMRKYQQGLLHAHDKAKQREQQTAAPAQQGPFNPNRDEQLEISDLYRTSRTGLAGGDDSRWARMNWTAKEYQKAHPDVPAIRVYKYLDRTMQR